jgi:hypothetical protein
MWKWNNVLLGYKWNKEETCGKLEDTWREVRTATYQNSPDSLKAVRKGSWLAVKACIKKEGSSRGWW